MKRDTCTFGVSNNKTNSVTIPFAKWINSMEWDFFCTFTTSYSMSIRSARRAMERLFNFIKKHNDEVKLFWVAEPFDTKYGYHTHALIRLGLDCLEDIEKLIRKAWQIVSKGKGGKEYNHTTLNPYNKNLGGNFYISKYMARKNADYDILF